MAASAIVALISLTLASEPDKTIPAGPKRSPTAAAALFRKGRKLLDEGDLGGACRVFQESLTLQVAVGTLLNLASCEEASARLLNAKEHWNEAIRLMAEDDERLPFARDRAAALERRIPRVLVRLDDQAPPDAEVWMNGAKVMPERLGVPCDVDPGKVELMISAPGHSQARSSITVAEGEQREIAVGPGPPTTVPAAALEHVAPPASADARDPPVSDVSTPARAEASRTWLPWIVGGAGVATAAGGSILIATVAKDYDALKSTCGMTTSGCPESEVSPVHARANVSYVLLAAGAAGIVAGVLFWLAQ
jgi:hypothetical protein